MPDKLNDADLARQLESWAASEPAAELSPEIRQKIRGALSPSLAPVTPLPSQGWLILRFLAVFVLCAGGLIAILGKTGFRLMTGFQMGAMAAILVGAGILLSRALASKMIPGSRQALAPTLVLAVSGLGVIGVTALLFPWRASSDLVPEGWPCAVLELMIAVPATVVFGLLARRGVLYSTAGLGAILTGLAVCLALIPLQSQCMFQRAPHLLLWHLGTGMLVVGLGALIGWRGRDFWIP